MNTPENTIQTFINELEARSLEPKDHIARLVRLTDSLGRMFGLNEASLEALQQAAQLHDIGKLVLPEQVQLKAAPLDANEWSIIRTHPHWSAQLARGIPGVSEEAIRAVLEHHERWDGTGYPNGLKRDSISLEARILSVCDVYDTLLSKRAYSRAWSVQATLEELQAQRRKLFDPRVVDLFVERAMGKLTLTDQTPPSRY